MFLGGDITCGVSTDYKCEIDSLQICVEEAKLCDGSEDCDDRSDEVQCGITCDSQEVPADQRCDGVNNCGTGDDAFADELGCAGCQASEFYCEQSSRCISGSLLCNGVNDCDDFEDEVLCKFRINSKVNKFEHFFAIQVLLIVSTKRRLSTATTPHPRNVCC